jgi:hypothetical protein
VDLPGVREENMEETSSTMDSAAIGAVMDSRTMYSMSSRTSEVTERVPNGSKKTAGMREVFTAPSAHEIMAEGGEEDESEDGDDEEGEVDDNEDEEDEDEEEEDEEDDDEEEEQEPALKYSKIEGAAVDILEKDAASAIAVGETYFVSLLPEGP